MKKFLFWTFGILSLWIFLSRCVVCQMRWSDAKARAVFRSRGLSLSVFDTVINRRHIHYAVCGSDSLPTLVFIHGSPGSWMHYQHFMSEPALLARYRVVGFDRPGFGHSDFGDALNLREQADLVLPVLRALKNNRPILVCGHSLGGPLAVKLAAADPALIDTLVLVAAALDPALERKETWRRVMNTKPLDWLMPGAFRPSNTELLYLKEDLFPLSGDFAKVRSAVVMMHGDKDNWVPIENIAYGERMLVNAASLRSDTVPGGDHNFPWKMKDRFKQRLLDLGFRQSTPGVH